MEKNEQENFAEVLAFKLGGEEYGIGILKVQEIRGYERVTRIANTPDYIKGLVNLRGIIVPVIDMRLRFNIGQASYDESTVVIILNIDGATLGMVVDAVSDVAILTRDQIKIAPEMVMTIAADTLIGLGTLDDRMLILLDIDKVMNYNVLGLNDLPLAA